MISEIFYINVNCFSGRCKPKEIKEKILSTEYGNLIISSETIFNDRERKIASLFRMEDVRGLSRGEIGKIIKSELNKLPYRTKTEIMTPDEVTRRFEND